MVPPMLPMNSKFSRRQVAGLSLLPLAGLLVSGTKTPAAALGSGYAVGTGWRWELDSAVRSLRWSGYLPLAGSGYSVRLGQGETVTASEALLIGRTGQKSGQVDWEVATGGATWLEADFLNPDFEGYWNVYLSLMLADGSTQDYHVAGYHQGAKACRLGQEGCSCCSWAPVG